MLKKDINKILPIFGAIAGDIIGSSYELKGHRTKNYKFDLFTSDSTFTDDTVLTIAVAKWLIDSSSKLDQTMIELCLKYKDVGYGQSFKQWLISKVHKPYNSFGNGSAMRVSAVALKSSTLQNVMMLAYESAAVTHNHPEGIKGAQVVAAAIFLALNGFTKLNIKEHIKSTFNYDLDQSLSDIRKTYSFDSSCQGSVPEVIMAFLESENFEDAIRLSVSLGGDADTQASITGAIAASYYQEIPNKVVTKIIDILPQEFIQVLHDFIKSENSDKKSFILISKEDLYVDSLIQYTFCLAVTDKTQVFIPKGTRIWVVIIQRKCVECHIINNKSVIFSTIERDLKSKYAVFYATGKNLCSAISIQIPDTLYDKFLVSYPTDNDLFAIFKI